jgi:hypothetical protein
MDGLTLIFPMDGFRLCARTSACQRFFLLAQLAFLHGGFVIFLCFAFFEADRARRAGRQAVSETVTVIVSEELGFSIYHSNRPFVAGLCAQSTAVARLFVYFDDFPDHILFPHF